MGLARRTVLSYGWVLVLAAGACAYVLYGLDQIAERTAAERRISEAVEHANRVDAEALRGILLLEQYVDAPSSDKLAALHVNRRLGSEARLALRSITRLPRIVELLDAYDAILPQRTQLADRIVDQAGSGGESIPALRRERDALDRQARAYLQEIVDIENRAVTESTAQTAELTDRIRINTVFLFGVMLVMVVAISINAAHDISRRLVPLLAMSQRLSRGRLDTRMTVEGGDEIAVLATSFNEMAARLQELDTAKDEFVALASHQLRTPATAVKANILMLLDGYFGELAPEQREVLGDAFASNERQLEVIEDILNVARASTGRLELERSEADLVGLVGAAVAEHRPGIAGRGQQLDVSLPPAPLPVAVDARKMRMVLDNLLGNASKYTPDGGRVAVRVTPGDEAVTIAVSDTGVGVAPGDQARLFRKFSRIENALSATADGTGLGLYLVHEIVRLHGGSIAVRSAVGQGSEFTVSIPRR
jgi:signal transduction histidine kinase